MSFEIDEPTENNDEVDEAVKEMIPEEMFQEETPQQTDDENTEEAIRLASKPVDLLVDRFLSFSAKFQDYSITDQIYAQHKLTEKYIMETLVIIGSIQGYRHTLAVHMQEVLSESYTEENQIQKSEQ